MAKDQPQSIDIPFCPKTRSALNYPELRAVETYVGVIDIMAPPNGGVWRRNLTRDPDTLMAWHRKRIATKWNYVDKRGPGRVRALSNSGMRIQLQVA